MPVVTETITLEQIEALRPAKLWYGARTCWWTHDPRHICVQGNQPGALPCDPRGGPLLECKDPAQFFAHAREQAAKGYYGKHGLRTFIAAHHLNCQVGPTDRRATCLTDWEQYDQAVAALDRRRQEQLELCS